MKTKRRWYALYNNYTTFMLTAGVLAMYIGSCWLIVFFTKFSIVKGDLSAAIFMPILLFVPLGIFSQQMIVHRLPARLFARCQFDEEGIHGYYILWGRFFVGWDDIRTYGVFNSSAGYVSMDLFFFSKDPGEVDNKKTRFLLSRDRVLFEYRPTLWAAISEYAPEDIVKNLEYSFDTRTPCFMKRPGGKHRK